MRNFEFVQAIETFGRKMGAGMSYYRLSQKNQESEDLVAVVPVIPLLFQLPKQHVSVFMGDDALEVYSSLKYDAAGARKVAMRAVDMQAYEAIMLLLVGCQAYHFCFRALHWKNWRIKGQPQLKEDPRLARERSTKIP